MPGRALNGFVGLIGAVVTALGIQWILIQGIGLEAQDVFQGVTITAAVIGVAYLSDLIPGQR
jgi:hypothetical protein